MAKAIKIRNIFDPTEDEGIVCPLEEAQTKQSFKDECDINNILKRYEATGQLPDMIKSDPIYGDFSSPIDYQEALNVVIRAEEQFSALSAAVRDRFANDPAKFLAFMEDPNNGDEIIKLGLATAREHSGATTDRVPEAGTGQAGASSAAKGGSKSSGNAAGSQGTGGAVSSGS